MTTARNNLEVRLSLVDRFSQGVRNAGARLDEFGRKTKSVGKNVTADLGKPQQSVGILQKQTQQLGTSMFSLTTQLGALGLSSFGVGLAIRGLASEQNKLADVTAQTGFIVRQLGEAAQLALEDARPSFEGIASAAFVTQADVEKAFGIIIQASGGIPPSMDELRGAFDLARATGTDFETAAQAIGAAMLGDYDAIRKLTDPSGVGSFKTLEQTLADARIEGQKSLTVWERMGVRLSRGFEAIGKAVTMLFEGQFSGLWEFLKSNLPENNLIVQVGKAIEGIIRIGKITIEFAIETAGDAWEWIKRIGKWINEGIQPAIDFAKNLVIPEWLTTLASWITKGLDIKINWPDPPVWMDRFLPGDQSGGNNSSGKGPGNPSPAPQSFGGMESLAAMALAPAPAVAAVGGGSTTIVNINAGELIVDNEQRERALAERIARQLRDLNRAGVGVLT